MIRLYTASKQHHAGVRRTADLEQALRLLETVPPRYRRQAPP